METKRSGFLMEHIILPVYNHIDDVIRQKLHASSLMAFTTIKQTLIHVIWPANVIILLHKSICPLLHILDRIQAILL